MVARIADSTWSCDCCGRENDQRGCVKGPPQCDCYYNRPMSSDVVRYSFTPAFCIICGRCQSHCTGSEFYREPKTDYMFKYLDNDAPIKKETKPHTFVQFGLCSCENVDDDELFAEVVIKDGTTPRRVHIRCGMWRLDLP